MTVATRNEGHNPDWDIDLALGESTEQSLIELFNAINLRHTTLEVKNESRQALSTGNIYIEFEQTPQGQPSKPSGIRTSRADWYALHFGDVVVLAPTKVVYNAAKKYGARHPESVRRGGLRGDNPTRGVVVPLGDFLKLANEEPF